jgi:hypothetical protein
MKTKKKILIGAGVFVVAGAFLARSPDLDLKLSREIPTSLSVERLDLNIASVARWPQWFFSLSKASVIEARETPGFSPGWVPAGQRDGGQTPSRPSVTRAFRPGLIKQPNLEDHLLDPSLIKTGALLRLEMKPARAMSKSYHLIAKVTEYEPKKRLSLVIIEDSSGRLTRLFNLIQWNLTLEPTPTGSTIHVRELAHTQHWKSRFFGRMAEKILMNQIYYPDIIKLAELKQPFSVDEGIPNQSGF